METEKCPLSGEKEMGERGEGKKKEECSRDFTIISEVLQVDPVIAQTVKLGMGTKTLTSPHANRVER